MYEYIPNAIIEGTLRKMLSATCYLFFIINEIWYHADVYYFGGLDEADEEDVPNHIPAIDSGEIGNIGWEYEYQDILTTLYNYFFTKDDDPDTDANQDTDDLPALVPLPTPATVPYPEKYNELWKKKSPTFKSKDNVDAAALKNNILFEHTPFGNVIMYYDADKTSFIYYSDKTLSYPIINSVGRKYALTFGCEAFYIDKTTAPPEPEPEPEKATAPEPATVKPAAAPTSVYAKFKNYKKPKPNTTNTASNTNAAEEQINRYTCEGKLSNFNILKKIPKVKAFSYKDFKNKKIKTQ